MYYLYIDESGHVQNYQPAIHNHPDHKYFVLGGIIVHEDNRRSFNDAVKSIISRYFDKKTLPPEFKLCYHGLRQCKKPPYDKLCLDDKLKIADEMFDAIAKLDCHLISAQINLDYIYNNYVFKIPQRTLALCFMAERFQRFLTEHISKGIVIHEHVTAELNKDMQTNYGSLFHTHNLPKVIDFTDIAEKIQFATACEEPILQFSDFFAYSVLIKAKTEGKKQTRWQSVASKYYNLDHGNSYSRGNCSI